MNQALEEQKERYLGAYNTLWTIMKKLGEDLHFDPEEDVFELEELKWPLRDTDWEYLKWTVEKHTETSWWSLLNESDEISDEVKEEIGDLFVVAMREPGDW